MICGKENFNNYMLFNKIYLKYANEMWIHAGDCGKDKRAHSIVSKKEVVVPMGTFSNPAKWDILVLLHEIGHIKTNKDSMKVYEKEFLATQWAANEAKNWGFKIEKEWKQIYQNYIWEKRDMCIRKGGKNVADKNELVVKW